MQKATVKNKNLMDKKMRLTNKLYNTIKWISQLFLPAVATLYFALSSIWHFPYGEEIVGTITAVDAFLGALLGISSVGYYKDDTKRRLFRFSFCIIKMLLFQKSYDKIMDRKVKIKRTRKE